MTRLIVPNIMACLAPCVKDSCFPFEIIARTMAMLPKMIGTKIGKKIVVPMEKTPIKAAVRPSCLPYSGWGCQLGSCSKVPCPLLFSEGSRFSFCQ